jgi:hypothetical protein
MICGRGNNPLRVTISGTASVQSQFLAIFTEYY